jgi:hypothetical protein
MKKVNLTKQHSMKCPKLCGKKCTCDGYHTFDELYEHRITLFIALCKELSRHPKNEYAVWRARQHSDGSNFNGWFVMGIGINKGSQITYHLPLSKWGETNFVDTFEKAPEFDGHTSQDVLERVKSLI